MSSISTFPTELYSKTLSLLMTDLYQLTMAQAMYKAKKHDEKTIFHLFFRKNPFGGKFAIAAGTQYPLEVISSLQFSEEDLEFLKYQKTSSGQPLFEKSFLNFLSRIPILSNKCKIFAIPEGTLVFPNEPLMRIEGSWLQCQLLETILLNVINFQTLIATKAARICQAAQGDKVYEFGLRRAQGLGGLEASRAAFIGGCAGTSNVLAGKVFDIPVVGTMAHSWVMAFNSETEAFEAWCKTMPHQAVLLVDTYDARQGILNAVQAGLKLKKQGYQLQGIRLDSGDLLALSRFARNEFDKAGLYQVKIMASDDLNEEKIAVLKAQKAPIDSWGVGTQLVTGGNQSALGGVYKMGCINLGSSNIFANPNWKLCQKNSEDPQKATIPGKLSVQRTYDESGMMQSDCIKASSSDILTIPDLLTCAPAKHSLYEVQAYCHSQLQSLPENYQVTIDRTEIN